MSCGGRTASRTADPTAYPRRPTSNGNSEANSCTLTVPNALPLRPDQAEVDIEGWLVGVGHRKVPSWDKVATPFLSNNQMCQSFCSVLSPRVHEDVDGRVDFPGGGANGGRDALVARSLEGIQTRPMSRQID